MAPIFPPEKTIEDGRIVWKPRQHEGHTARLVQQALGVALTELGLWILQLSGETADGLSRALESQIRAAVKEHVTKDLTFSFGDQSAGLTIHLSALPDEIAQEKILQHCQLKKYDLKADRWYGLILRPKDLRIRHALVLNDPWKKNITMDKVLAALPRRARFGLKPWGGLQKKSGATSLARAAVD